MESPRGFTSVRFRVYGGLSHLPGGSTDSSFIQNCFVLVILASGNPTPFRELMGLRCYCCNYDFTMTLVSERTAGIARGLRFSRNVRIPDYSSELVPEGDFKSLQLTQNNFLTG